MQPTSIHRSPRRALKPEANFYFFSAHEEEVVHGIRFDDLLEPGATHNIAVPTVVIGPKRAPWSKFIRPISNDAPLYDHNKVWRGSIIKDPNDERQKRDVMVEYRDDESNYVLVRSGLRMIERGGTMSKGNFWQLLADQSKSAVTHGAYSFDREAVQGHKSIRIATAEDAEQIAEGKLRNVMTEPDFKMGNVAAERMGTLSIGRKIKGVGCPETVYVMWRMPFGAVLLVRDVDGKMSRLISSKAGVRRVDAPGYEDFFEAFDEAYRKAAAEAKAKEPTGDPNYKDGLELKASGQAAAS